MQMEFAAGVSWDLPLSLDIVPASASSAIQNSMSSNILLGKVDLLSMSLSSNNELADTVMSHSEDSMLAHMHIELHVVLLSVLPESSDPSWGIASDLELSLAVPWDRPLSNPAVVLDSSLVDHSMLADILLVEGEVGVVPFNSSGNVESTNGVTSMTPDVTTVVDLEVLEAHVVLVTILFVPAGPGDFPVVVP